MKIENSLERCMQSWKSYGKAFWIGAVITLGALLSLGSEKNENIDKYIWGVGAISGVVAMGSMYKNRKRIKDCLDLNITNGEIKNKYGLTGDTYFFQFTKK